VEETSILLLALAHAAWQRQAFAHRRLRARPLIPFHITLDQNIKRDPFKSEALESKTYSVHVQARRSPSNSSKWHIKAGSCYALRLRFRQWRYEMENERLELDRTQAAYKRKRLLR
jgi:hypothetical protein